jgi:glycosyltransferase involved in cell wall biosynthesis
MGASVGEATACGLPVIASSKVGAGHDLISEGKKASVVSFGDIQQLKSQLDFVLDRCSRKSFGGCKSISSI